MLNNCELNTTADSPFATGGAVVWQGYISPITATGVTALVFTRPDQKGTDTSSQPRPAD